MIARVPFFPRAAPELRQLFAEAGLTLIGVADPAPAYEAELDYREWIESGYAGSMSYLERHAPLKYAPYRILPEVKSILFAAINYFQRPDGKPQRDVGRVARYAWGRDYHKVMGAKLRSAARSLAKRYPQERFKPFTDSTPLSERYYAERAGIGFTGRNTLLISSQFGSWFLIGEVLSTRYFEASGPAGRSHGGCPSNCRKCIDICPTGALLGPHRIDARRCISYLTIEYKGSIPLELRPAIGDWLFGCDLCQEICPLNLREQQTDVEDFVRVKAGSTLQLEEILSIETDAAFTERFAGSPLMRAKRRGLLRNACIVSANNGASGLLPLLRRRSADSDPIIAEHARWAIERLEEDPGGISAGDGSESSDHRSRPR